MNNEFLEKYYEKTILPEYGDVISFPVAWKSHGKVGPDSWAHYFDSSNGVEFVLVYEDFPERNYLEDGLSHEIIKCGNETSLHVSSSRDKSIDNLFGYFTLYKEKVR